MKACRANNYTDLVIVNEHRGEPTNLIVCHLPYGPTAFFNITNTVMRHDIENVGTMSEAYPHLIFSNMTSKLGERLTNVLKHLFPVPRPDSKRIMTFANQGYEYSVCVIIGTLFHLDITHIQKKITRRWL